MQSILLVTFWEFLWEHIFCLRQLASLLSKWITNFDLHNPNEQICSEGRDVIHPKNVEQTIPNKYDVSNLTQDFVD